MKEYLQNNLRRAFCKIAIVVRLIFHVNSVASFSKNIQARVIHKLLGTVEPFPHFWDCPQVLGNLHFFDCLIS